MLFQSRALAAVIVVLLAATCYPQDAQQGSQNPISDAVKFPYIGKITGDNVYVRSGDGISYYFCSKLGKGDTVTVVDHSTRWAKIMPPAGSFSWIYKSYVKLDKANPGLGQVTTDNVRAWAGSERIPPDDSTSLQAKLNEGDIVRLIEPQLENSDYYKIVPPAGARLYVSMDYVDYYKPVPVKPLPQIPPRPDIAQKPLPQIPPRPGITQRPQPDLVGPPVTTEAKIVGTVSRNATKTPDTTAAKTPEPQPSQPDSTTVDTGSKQVDLPVPITQTEPAAAGPFSEAELILQCTDIGEQIRAEFTKPSDQQDYAQFSKKLNVIMLDPNLGNARIYAEYYLDRLESYELVRKASQLMARQESELKDVRAKISKDYQQKLAAIPRAGKYIIIGEITLSQAYTQTIQKRYVIKNSAGRIIAYAVPASKLADAGVENLINKNVGLVGKIISDPASPVTLIEFTQAERLPDKSDATSK